MRLTRLMNISIDDLKIATVFTPRGELITERIFFFIKETQIMRNVYKTFYSNEQN